MTKIIVLSMLVLSAGWPALAQDLSATREIIQYEQIGDNVYYSYKGEPTGTRNIISSTRESISPTQYRIYPQQKFYQEGNNWYTIERDISPAELFIAPAKPISGYFVNIAKADYIPVTGIFGCTRGTNANYSTAGSTGTAINPCANNSSLGDVSNTLGGSGNYFRTRLGLGFDATGLTISSSTLYILPSQVTNHSSDSLSVVVLTPNSYSTLVSADHTNFGTTKIASDRPLGQFAVGVLQGMAITDVTTFTGVFAIGLRTAKDISSTAPGAGQYNDLAVSNIYLEVETSGGSPTPTPTPTTSASTTISDYQFFSDLIFQQFLVVLISITFVLFVYRNLN